MLLEYIIDYFVLIQTPFQVFESTTVRAIRKYKLKKIACLNLLFRGTRYHYKFGEVAVRLGIEFATIQKLLLYTFGGGSSGQKNLRSIPAEDRSGGRRPDCLTATSDVRGEAARNWSPASTFVCVRLEQGTPTNLRDVEEGADLDPA